VFGLLPAALHGVDLDALLRAAQGMADACRRPAAANPGLRLGATIGEAALAGRDKLTILTSRRLESFGDWAEQLVAESTGKQGRGIVPIVGEPPLEAERYGTDRCFVVITLEEASGPPLADLAELADLAAALEGLGHPVLRIGISDPAELGAEFVRWEVATAAAGMILDIDPFDQPNVQESKDATRELLDAFRKDGRLPSPAPIAERGGLAAYSESEAVLGASDPAAALRALLETVQQDDYLAVLAYLPRNEETQGRLQQLRAQMGAATGAATTLGFGPRFLHSTGQLHKGGPDSGVFLQLTAEPERDLPIPGWTETFGTLIAAQALGDLRSLQSRHRRALRLHGDDWRMLLSALDEMIPRTAAAGIGG